MILQFPAAVRHSNPSQTSGFQIPGPEFRIPSLQIPILEVIGITDSQGSRSRMNVS